MQAHMDMSLGDTTQKRTETLHSNVDKHLRCMSPAMLLRQKSNDSQSYVQNLKHNEMTTAISF